MTCISRVTDAPAASVPSKESEASQRSSPKVASDERNTRSDQGLIAVAVPLLVTVQATVIVSPGRALAGAVIPETARSAYGATVEVRAIEAVLFVSPVPSAAYS